MSGVHFANAVDDFDGRRERLKLVAVGHVELRSTAKFARELVKSRLEINFTEERARQS